MMPTQINTFSSKKIAIIGAGISGLSCAAQLHQQGHLITVFDKSKGVAGRMSTKRLDQGFCDHGAQYFTCNDSLFANQIQTWLDAKVVAVWDIEPAVLGGRARAKELTQEQGLEGSSSGQAKKNNTIRYVGLPGMTAPAKYLEQELKNKGVNILTSHTISQINKVGQQWQLTSLEQQDHQSFFDVVILAIPAPQVHPLISPHNQSLAAICNINMTPCFALMVQFETSPQLSFNAAFVNQGPLSWIAFNSHKPERTGPPTWLLHASAQWSKEHLEKDPQWVQAQMLKAFEQWVLLDKGLEMDSIANNPFHLKTTSLTLHRWKYANLDNMVAIPNAYAWDPELQIGLCGDWLNGGKVQGAWLSGHQLAIAI